MPRAGPGRPGPGSAAGPAAGIAAREAWADAPSRHIKLTGDTWLMMLSWLMPYFASA
jgi:hypothetical protein